MLKKNQQKQELHHRFHSSSVFTKKLNKWVDTKLNPIMMKVGNQKHLSSVRDAFASLVPLIIAGSLGILINAVIFGGAGSHKISLLAVIDKIAHPRWNWNAPVFTWSSHNYQLISQIGGLIFGYISVATLGAFSLYIAFLIPYFLATYRKFKAPVLCGTVGLVSFLIAIMGQVQYFLDAKGLIIAIIIGFVSAELFVWFGNMRQLQIKLSSGVPSAVGKSFAVFLPATFVLTIVALLNVFFLVPALVSTNWTINGGMTATYHQIWNYHFGDKLTGKEADSFYAWMHQYHPADFGNVFTNGKWNADTTFGGWGDGDPNQMIAKIKNDLTATGQSLLGQFMYYHINHGMNIPHLTGNVSLTFHTFVHAGCKYLLISIKFHQVQIESTTFGLGAAIYKFLSSWFIHFATGNGGLLLAFLYTFFVSVFWWFGIHGDNVLSGIFAPIWLMILGINGVLIGEGSVSATYSASSGVGVFAKPFFDSYILIGGSGATLALVLMTLLFSKRRDWKEVSTYALPAGCFNINEPVIFGFPLVLNLRMLVPFLLAPVSCLIVAWLTVGVFQWVSVLYIATPWTAPWFLVALLSTGLNPWALVLAGVCFVISVCIWCPFVWFDNYLYLRHLKATAPALYQATKRYAEDKNLPAGH